MDNHIIDPIIATFPETFGVKGHPGSFQISRDASFIGDDGFPQLYLQIRRAESSTDFGFVPGAWLDYTRVTEWELRDVIITSDSAYLAEKKRVDAFISFSDEPDPEPHRALSVVRAERAFAALQAIAANEPRYPDHTYDD